MTEIVSKYDDLHKNSTGNNKKYYYRRLPAVRTKKKDYNYKYKRDKENHDKHIAYMVEYNKKSKERRYTLLLTRIKCPCCQEVVNRGYLNKHKLTSLCKRRGAKLIKEH